MYILAPSIYAADTMELERQLRILEEAGITRLHVDIMDGRFVPGFSFGADFVEALRRRTGLELDVHLMAEHPGTYVEDFLSAGADILTVDWEAEDSAVEILKKIRERRRRPGIVLKPESDPRKLPDEVWELADVVQLMTVAPGLKGQHFLEAVLPKIAWVRRRIEESGRRIQLETDGDINETNLEQVLEAGADVIVMGKALFGGNLERNLFRYRKRARKAAGPFEKEALA